jgi:DNA-binding GntR family transcriptional regulator
MSDATSVVELHPDPKSLAEKAYQLLVHKIARLELAPGEPLVEKQLIVDLDVGRTPIREALQRLVAEGLVNHLPNRAMYVAEISATSVQHIYEFRMLIGGYCARLAALRASDGHLRDLRNIHDLLAQAIEDDDIDRHVELNRHFNQLLAQAAQNIYLAEVIPRIFNLHLRLWFLISERLGSWHGLARAHEEMAKGVIEGIAHRDPEMAELSVRVYVMRRHQEIRGIL